MQDILVGVILGGLIGFGIFNLIYYAFGNTGPTLLFYAKEDNTKNVNYLKQNLDAPIVKCIKYYRYM